MKLTICRFQWLLRRHVLQSDAKEMESQIKNFRTNSHAVILIIWQNQSTVYNIIIFTGTSTYSTYKLLAITYIIQPWVKCDASFTFELTTKSFIKWLMLMYRYVYPYGIVFNHIISYDNTVWLWECYYSNKRGYK